MISPKTIYLKDYTPPPYFIKSVDLNFKLHEERTQVSTRLVFIRNQQKKPTQSLVLQGEHLDLVFIKLNNRQLLAEEYRRSTQDLTIFQVPNEFSLEIETIIKPKENTALSGLYISRGIFCTQCEAEGFRRITYFLDRPDVLTTYTTTLIADKRKYPILLSNGNKIAEQTLEGNLHSATWKDPFKKPSYLFALVAGNLESIHDYFITQANSKVSLHIFSETGKKEECHYAMEALKKAMRWDEETYGRLYDLSIFMIAVIEDFNMGAMENKGLNIFNAQTLLASPASATDTDYNSIAKVIAHEYFHNWTGNRITCRDWFQLSLKEGLTVFREQEFSESIGNAGIERISTVRQLRARQFPEDSGPLAHPVQPDSYIEINNFYTATVYEKGAELIRMMKVLVGTELFRKGMDIYFEKHDGQAVTIEDFILSIETGSGYNLRPFRRWYKQSGTPVVEAYTFYSPKTKIFSLKLKQSCPPTPGQPSKKPFYIPLAMSLFDPQKKAPMTLHLEEQARILPDKSCLLLLTKKEQNFQFVQVNTRPIPSLLRNFSAPVKLKIDLSDEELAFLIENETDTFSRWDAAQQLIHRIILQSIDSTSAQSNSNSALHLLIKVLRRLLDASKPTEQGLLAELLRLPSEAYFAEHMKTINVEGLYEARKELRFQMAQHLETRFAQTYQSNYDLGPYHYDTLSAERRQLVNTCLSYLMLLKKPSYEAYCVLQFNNANNMTDRIHTLSELVQHNLPQCGPALSEFYQTWSQNSVVLCLWFAIQARVTSHETLSRVKQLLHHSAFDWKNPNKIRALIGTFCTNWMAFHDASGTGYRFLTQQILYLDQFNPQIAARLVTPFAQWKRFDLKRQTLMKEQLESILKNENLSIDVFERVKKAI